MGVWDNFKEGYSRAGALGGLYGAAGGDTPDVFGGLASDRTDNPWRDPDRSNFDLPGFQQRDQFYGQQLGQAQSRGAFQAYEDPAFRARQQQLADILMGQATGQNSLAAEQLRQGQMANIAQQQAMAASARPGMGVAAQRMAMQNAARMGYGLSGQQALAGIQERQAAAMGLGGVLAGARGQDQSMSQFNAAQQQQNRNANDAYMQSLMGLQQQNAGMQQQGGIGYEGARTDRFAAAVQQPTKEEQYKSAIIGGASLLGGV